MILAVASDIRCTSHACDMGETSFESRVAGAPFSVAVATFSVGPEPLPFSSPSLAVCKAEV